MENENTDELSGYDQLEPLFKEGGCYCLDCDGKENCSCGKNNNGKE